MRISSKSSRREFWRQAVARQRSSGLSVQRFCEQEALATATFYHWKRRLGQAIQGRQETPASVAFAPVQVVPETAPVSGGMEIVLPHDWRVRLTGTVDRQQLADVLSVLGEMRACRPC